MSSTTISYAAGLVLLSLGTIDGGRPHLGPWVPPDAHPVWMVVGAAFDGRHRSVDAIQYATRDDCDRERGIMLRKTLRNAGVIQQPYCTDQKPTWWRD